MNGEPNSLFVFKIHGTGPDGPAEFGCFAPDEKTGLALAFGYGLAALSMKSSVPPPPT
jgi:hypothetical protein